MRGGSVGASSAEPRAREMGEGAPGEPGRAVS